MAGCVSRRPAPLTVRLPLKLTCILLDSNNSLSIGPSAVHSGQSGALYNPYAYDSSSSTSSPAPPAAFVPSLKILKRPTDSTGSSSAANSQAARELQKKSLKDRERAYHEARNRIFGAGAASSSASTPISGTSSPTSGALSPKTPAMDTSFEPQNLASSVDKLTLDGEKEGVPVSVGMPRGDSSRGKQRTPGRGVSTPTGSTPTSSRPSTPSTTIIREPVNPPSSADKNSSATAQMHARGFSKTKKKKILSPAAAAFVPGSFAPKPQGKNAKQVAAP